MKRRRKNSVNTGKIVRLDPLFPDPALVRAAVLVLEQKGVLVFPTTGLYGLGADARSVEAIRRVYACKRRPPGQPLLVLLSTIRDMDWLVREVPDYATPLFSLWPGDITLIFNAADGVPDELTGATSTIGVRMPVHPVARKIVETFGGPITGTSANLSGQPAVSDARRLDPEIEKQADLVVDAGPLAGGVGSTILDVSGWPVRLIREGRVAYRTIQSLLGR